MIRIVRGLASLIILVGVLVGIPLGLAAFGGNPVPDSLSWQAVTQALLTPASDRTLIGIVAVVGWIAWAGFALCVLAELVNTLSGRRVRLRLPGLQVGQKLAAVLIITVIAMLATPNIASTPASPSQPAAPATVSASAQFRAEAGQADRQGSGAVSAERSAQPAVHVAGLAEEQQSPAGSVLQISELRPSAATGERTPPRRVVHEVRRGEFLWTLAERYLGDGSQWRTIANANPDISPDHLAIGQKLIIPIPATHSSDSDNTPDGDGGGGDTVTVERGDSLSSISDDLYGTETRWPALYRENQHQIHDPDEIDVGQKLLLPDEPHRTHTDHAISHHDPVASDDRQQAQPTPKPQTGDEPTERQHTTAHTPAPSTTPGTTPAAPVQPSPAEPSTARPTATQPAASARSAPAEPGTTAETLTTTGISVGLLLAAGLLTTINLRRRRQLRARPPGRRIAAPEPPAQEFEQAVKAQHQPLRVEQLDQVMRAVAAHCHHTGQQLPPLSAVRVADHRIDLLLQQPTNNPPPGIELTADGAAWTLHATNTNTLLAVDGIDNAASPYPALVTLGRDADTAHILIDLEAAAALTITTDNPDTAAAMLATLALELAVSPWAADLNLTLVGPLLPGFAAALDHPSVTHLDDLEPVLTGLETRAAAQRPHLNDETVGQKRVNPDLADAWCPHVVLLGQDLTPDQSRRLTDIVTQLPRVAIAAVTTTSPPITPWQLNLNHDGATAHLNPHDWQLTPQRVTTPQYQHLLELISSSGTDETTPAPWWNHEPDPPQGQSASVTVLPTATPSDDAAPTETTDVTAATTSTRTPMTLRALTDTGSTPTSTAGSPRRVNWTETTADDRGKDELDLDALTADDAFPAHPVLRILGQPDLVGTHGAPNRRYQQRSMEFLLYLLERPGTTNARLTSEFCISRDYTKAVISNLRKTLGNDPEDRPYLPEVEARGGYRLHDSVTSDWHRATRLIGKGVNTAAPENLARVLAMIRGRPLEGAEDWIGTYTLRPDIISTLVDVTHELVTLALDRNDVRLARWATTQGLLTAPDSETLLTDRLRTENQAGNRTDVQRLAGRISANARALGVDLLDETQEVLRATART